MKKKQFLLALVLVLCLVGVTAFALGDDVDFGGSDWGGSDWGGSDWGSSDWDSDWGDSSWDSGGSGGGGVFNLGISPLFLVVAYLIVRIVLLPSKKNNRRRSSYTPRPSSSSRPSNRPTSTPGATKRVDTSSIASLKKKDPGFSEADIEAKVKNWVMKFEAAWCSGSMDSCRPFISDGLYNSYVSQLDMMKQNGEASRTEDLAVTQCVVESWNTDGDKEYLNVWLSEKKRTYKVSLDNPSKVIKGNRNITYNLEYRWQLMRSAGSISDDAGLRVQECPNCGAQTSINQSGKCEYCGSTLHTESFDWVLNKADKLAQREHR